MSFTRRLSRRSNYPFTPPTLDVSTAMALLETLPQRVNLANSTQLRDLYDRAIFERQAFEQGIVSEESFLETATALLMAGTRHAAITDRR